MIQGFDLGRRTITQMPVETLLVPPGHPLERGFFQGPYGPERLGAFDQFRPVRAVDGFGQSVVIGITHRSGRRDDPRLLQVDAIQGADALGGRHAGRTGPTRPGRGVGTPARAHGPAHDATRVRVGHERFRQANDLDASRTYMMSAAVRRPGARTPHRRSTRSGLPPMLMAGRVVTGIRPRRTPPDAEFTHDAQYPVAPDPLPPPGEQQAMDFPVPVRRHEPVRVHQLDVTRQGLVTGPHR